MQQRVGQRGLLPKVRSIAQQASERMLRRQFLERSDQRANSVVRGGNSDQAAELLDHVDAGPAVRRVHHEVQRAVGREHVAQRPQRRVGIFEMVQHARAHDLIEASSASSPTRSIGNCCTSRLARSYLRLSSSVQRTLVALKSMPVTLAFGQRSGVLGRLRRPAAGDEDGVVLPK